MLKEALVYLSRLAQGAMCVWFVCWAIRRRYELDVKLSRKEQLARWFIVAIAFGLTLVGSPRLAALRIIAGLVGIAFFAWPNLAHFDRRSSE